MATRACSLVLPRRGLLPKIKELATLYFSISIKFYVLLLRAKIGTEGLWPSTVTMSFTKSFQKVATKYSFLLCQGLLLMVAPLKRHERWLETQSSVTFEA